MIIESDHYNKVIRIVSSFCDVTMRCNISLASNERSFECIYGDLPVIFLFSELFNGRDCCPPPICHVPEKFRLSHM